MALSIPASSSATIGTTEYFLASASTTATYQTTDAVVQVFIDFAAMLAGDQYQITMYEKVSTTVRSVMAATVLTGVQSSLFVSPSFLFGTGWEIGVKKLAGTDRSILWSIRTST